MLKSYNVIFGALVVASVAAISPVHAADDNDSNVLTEDNFIMGVLDFIASPVTNTVADVVEGSCEFVNDLLFNQGNSSEFDCDCDGSFTVSDGMSLNLDCGYEENAGLCLFGFCGFPKLDASITPTGFEKIKMCVEFENDPSIPIPTLDPFCFTGYGIGWFSETPFAYDSCEVELDNQACECTVCENRQSFKYDCSMNTVQTNNVELEFLPDSTDGPKMDICLGVGTFEVVWDMLFPPPPTPAPTSSPTMSKMPTSVPSAAPSEMPTSSPVIEDDSGDFWDWLPW